jgi:acetyl-CoA acetyltransferase family protein
MREAVIVSAVRTPIGRARGTLSSVPAADLGAMAIREAVKRAQIDPSEIEDLFFGNLMANEYANIARVAALGAGLPYSVPAVMMDRQCGSSLTTFGLASMMIEGGQADIIVSAGVESDSRRTYVMEKPAMGYSVAPPQWANIKSAYAPEDCINMGLTAENLAEKYGISRVDCDAFSVLSHKKATDAWETGYFKEQIVPVVVDLGKGKTVLIDRDESVRSDCSLETLGKLPPVFKKDGVVTAGNSSPMSDGGGAAVLMEKEKAKSLGLPILGKFVGYTSVGLDPKYMGYGPVEATKKLLKKKGMTMNDIDLIEMNEAFAAQSIACINGLDMDITKLNVNGGAIALGHPLGGSGAVLIAKMVYELSRRGLERGLITFCVGGGQGVAAIIERE